MEENRETVYDHTVVPVLLTNTHQERYANATVLVGETDGIRRFCRFRVPPKTTLRVRLPYSRTLNLISELTKSGNTDFLVTVSPVHNGTLTTYVRAHTT